jgi:hypothetical protein
MATSRGPRGRMTKPVVTKHNVGDSVTMVADLRDEWDECPPVGAVGVIRRIVIADPNDGDNAFLMFDVRFQWGAFSVSEAEIASGQDVEPALWLQKQLATLDCKEW